LFARIIGLESTTYVPRNIIYPLHFPLHEKAIIDRGYLILSEVSFQLGDLKKTRKLYMTSYLIFSIAYSHVFEYFLREMNIDFNMEPVYAWYSTLYRHKAQYSFYPDHNNFILEFNKLIFGLSMPILSLEAIAFLSGKCICCWVGIILFACVWGGMSNLTSVFDDPSPLRLFCHVH
jgi:hypothetical protein